MKNSTPLRGAVIGFGFISGKGHMPAFLERSKNQGDFEIVAVADICEARRSLASDLIPGVRVYENYQLLLKAEAKNLDFVDIATPPCEHAEIANAALDLGLHVLCEKPLTTNLEDAQSLLDHAQEAKRVLFPCHNYKHAPVVKAINEIIDSGKIGKVRSVTLNTFRNTHAKGVQEWKTDWRRHKKWSGGGIAMDHGSHSFYLTFDWLKSLPISITAKMNTLDSQFDTEDNFSSVLSFPNGFAHTHLSWTAGVRKVIYTIQGERGAVTVDDDNCELALMVKTDEEDIGKGAVNWKVEKTKISSDWMDSSHVSWFNSLLDQFKEAIIKEDFAGKEAQEALWCIKVITTAYRSAQENSQELHF